MSNAVVSKNVHTGPLTGDSKRSTVSTIVKDTMPLPPVALALPLEPASATGPPSPARGSAGMPPPPSPAGATYQPPPAAVPKQESHSPEATDDSKTEVKRKARIGKDMVRRNTMLLMCNPTVKREIESPKEKEIIEQKKEITSESEEIQKDETTIIERICEPQKLKEEKRQEEQEEKENKIVEEPSVKELEPCVLTTVAENVKVKNMKRKLSMTQEKQTEPEPVLSPSKKQKLGSYKDYIKKNTSTVKLNSGKQKLLQDQSKSLTSKTPKVKQKKLNNKRKLNSKFEQQTQQNKRLKLAKPLTASNLHNSKQNSKQKEKPSLDNVTSVAESTTKKSSTSSSSSSSKKSQVQSKSTAVAVLDNLITRNNIDKTIESVVSESIERTSTTSILPSSPTSSSSCSSSSNNKETSALKTVNNKCVKDVKDIVTTNKKSTNNKKCSQVKTKSECKKMCITRRKSKSKEIVPQVVSKVPRRSLHLPRWSNGWRWEGEPYESKVFLNVSTTTFFSIVCFATLT